MVAAKAPQADVAAQDATVATAQLSMAEAAASTADLAHAAAQAVLEELEKLKARQKPSLIPLPGRRVAARPEGRQCL
jgi:hypothetical protein